MGDGIGKMVGQIAGSVFGGAVGAAAGSEIGGLIDGLFGKKQKGNALASAEKGLMSILQNAGSFKSSQDWIGSIANFAKSFAG